MEIGNVVVVAPHPDDELIGCYELFRDGYVSNVIYCDVADSVRRIESEKFCAAFDGRVAAHFVDFHTFLSHALFFLERGKTLCFPDPVSEVHPDHRKYGSLGEGFCRESPGKGWSIVFYSVNMNVPYIHKVANPEQKKQMLDKWYPSQSDLWKTDARYYLFEGRMQWLMM